MYRRSSTYDILLIEAARNASGESQIHVVGIPFFEMPIAHPRSSVSMHTFSLQILLLRLGWSSPLSSFTLESARLVFLRPVLRCRTREPARSFPFSVVGTVPCANESWSFQQFFWAAAFKLFPWFLAFIANFFFLLWAESFSFVQWAQTDQSRYGFLLDDLLHNHELFKFELANRYDGYIHHPDPGVRRDLALESGYMHTTCVDLVKMTCAWGVQCCIVEDERKMTHVSMNQSMEKKMISSE